LINHKQEFIYVKDIIDEDFTSYKKAALLIGTCTCSFKCEKEDSNIHCQNHIINQQPNLSINISTIISRYLENAITQAIVFGGLEPLDQQNELLSFIYQFRTIFRCKDDIVIFTGYNEHEQESVQFIKHLDDLNLLYDNNIVIKYGRYKSTNKPHFDDVLGVSLISDNQYAKQY